MVCCQLVGNLSQVKYIFNCGVHSDVNSESIFLVGLDSLGSGTDYLHGTFLQAPRGHTADGTVFTHLNIPVELSGTPVITDTWDSLCYGE